MKKRILLTEREMMQILNYVQDVVQDYKAGFQDDDIGMTAQSIEKKNK